MLHFESPGTSVPTAELTEAGFTAHRLRFRDTPPDEPFCEWDTLGDVPPRPGLYAFTLQADGELAPRVVYVGMTTHLWMVTKGRLPDGSARPAQRYGRHRYAGATRARINGEIARARGRGDQVLHWLRPMPIPPGHDPRTVLLAAEAELIARWNLRHAGWNRG